MKRILALLFAMIFLCACQPTPEEEFVVGKVPIASANTENAKSAEPAPTDYEETIPVDKGALTNIQFAATLENMEVRTCPIYPLTPVSFDAETVDRMIRAFAPDTRISIGSGKMTLKDVEKAIAETLNHINNVDTKEFESEAAKEQYLQEEQEFLSEMQQAYRDMQNVTVEFVDAAALTERDKVDFRLIDASDQTVALGRITCGIEAGDSRASVFKIERKEEDKDIPADLEMPDPFEVQTICETFLQSAGIEGFSFNEIASAREVVYTRSVGKLPYAAAYGITALQWRDYDDGELFAEPSWLDESIVFFCKEGLVANVSWQSKSYIGSAVQEVPILPFSDLKQKIVNGLTYQWSMPLNDTEQSHRIEISRIQIGMKRIPVYGAVRQYQLVPVCTVIGRFVQKYRSPEDNPEIILDANNEWFLEDSVLLVLNAIDGSIVG